MTTVKVKLQEITSMKVARQIAGCRLLDAANAIGVSESQLSRIESGDYSIADDHVRRLAAFYRVTVAQLLGAEPLSVQGKPPKLRESQHSF